MYATEALSDVSRFRFLLTRAIRPPSLARKTHISAPMTRRTLGRWFHAAWTWWSRSDKWTRSRPRCAVSSPTAGRFGRGGSHDGVNERAKG